MAGVTRIDTPHTPNNQHMAANTQAAKPQAEKVTAREAKIQEENKQKQLSPSELKHVIKKINENVSILNKDVKFVYDDAIKSLVVKVIDAKTGKVIREIPPKEVINLQKKLSEVVGIIFDSKEVK